MCNKRGTVVPCLIVVILFLCLPVYACGMRHMIQGQVIDAQDGKPIENATVLIEWTKPLSYVPGFPGSSVVEVAEAVSDSKGYFKIPKHYALSYDYRLTIYKKGYVCWNNEKIFPTYEDRKDFALKNGTVIKMERLKESYNKLDHANFVLTYSGWRKRSGGLFDEAIKEEEQLDREHYQQLDKKWIR